MAFEHSYNSNRLKNKYLLPSSTVKHTVAFCELCKCQRTFSCGFCDSCNAGYIDLKIALSIPEPVNISLNTGSPCVGEPAKERET